MSAWTPTPRRRSPSRAARGSPARWARSRARWRCSRRSWRAWASRSSGCPSPTTSGAAPGAGVPPTATPAATTSSGGGAGDATRALAAAQRPHRRRPGGRARSAGPRRRSSRVAGTAGCTAAARRHEVRLRDGRAGAPGAARPGSRRRSCRPAELVAAIEEECTGNGTLAAAARGRAGGRGRAPGADRPEPAAGRRRHPLAGGHRRGPGRPRGGGRGRRQPDRGRAAAARPPAAARGRDQPTSRSAHRCRPAVRAEHRAHRGRRLGLERALGGAARGPRRRIPDGWTPDQAEAVVRRHLAAAAAADPWLARAPADVSPRLPGRGLRPAGGRAPRCRRWPPRTARPTASSPRAWSWPRTTDARIYLNRFGVPALCYGPRTTHIHGLDEAVELRSIVDGARTLARFLIRVRLREAARTRSRLNGPIAPMTARGASASPERPGRATRSSGAARAAPGAQHRRADRRPAGDRDRARRVRARAAAAARARARVHARRQPGERARGALRLAATGYVVISRGRHGGATVPARSGPASAERSGAPSSRAGRVRGAVRPAQPARGPDRAHRGRAPAPHDDVAAIREAVDEYRDAGTDREASSRADGAVHGPSPRPREPLPDGHGRPRSGQGSASASAPSRTRRRSAQRPSSSTSSSPGRHRRRRRSEAAPHRPASTSRSPRPRCASCRPAGDRGHDP